MTTAAGGDDEQHSDDRILEAALWAAGRCLRDELATALGWSRDRLRNAEDALQARLSHGVLTLNRTGAHINLSLDTTVLSPHIHQSLADAWSAYRPLTEQEARRLLTLIHDDVAEGRLGDPQLISTGGRREDASIDEQLIARGAAEYVSDPGLPAANRLRPHTDVMFALGLVESPEGGDHTT